MLKYLPVREIGYGVGLLILLFALYIGGYYLLVRKAYLRGSGETVPVYQLGDDYSEHFFSFWHEFDRKIRAEYWCDLRRDRGLRWH